MSDTEVTFEYQGRELGTIGSLMDEMSRIHKADDHDEAQRFMAAYRAHTEHADSNVGYLTGYMDRETMREMQAMFGAAHPVFGTSTPTAEEAIEAGKAMARGN